MQLYRRQGFYEKYIKRILDIICALAIVFLFGWLYLMVAVLVWIKLGRPIIFRQLRPGMIDPKNGRERIFNMYKFRTMSNERDDKGQLLPDEARLGKFGRALRSSSLDELPEIFNILRGDMSLIGPRPQLVRDMVFMNDKQRMRHTAKPGLSGLAQVMGRNAITWEEKLEWDLKYIERVSFQTDLKLVWLTFKKVFVMENMIECNKEVDLAADFGDYLLQCGKIDGKKYQELQAKANALIKGCEKKGGNNMTVKEQIRNNPKVSIIIPMYNAASTLQETIESVQAQTYKNWELILVDDCSKDKTKSLAEKFAERDSRIRIYQMEKNGGPGAATKMGFEKATGGLVAFLDADDLWPSEKLEKQIKFMAENNYEFTCSDYRWVDEEGKSLNKKIKCKTTADYKAILRTCPIGSSTVVITAGQLKKIEIPTIRKNNDYALWLRILKDGTKVYGIHEILMDYRIMSNSNSFDKRKMMKYFWKVYREQEGFSVAKSVLLLGQYTFIKLVGIK